MRKVLQVLVIGVLICTPGLAEITTTDMGTLTPAQVAALLAGPGIIISNLTLTGAPGAAGSFSGASGFGIDSGIVMSSGNIVDVAGPNDSQGTTGTLGTPGDAQLDALVTPNETEDATILEFDFITESENFQMKYVFGSEEYKEYVDFEFNDVFAFFLDGKNIALIPNTSQAVSINNVNHLRNTNFFLDNPPDEDKYDIEFDGLTTVLTAGAIVTPGQQYHIKLAIADTADSLLDSAVFLAQGGITGTTPATLVVDPKEVILENEGSATVKLEGFFLPKGELFLSASGLPADSSITFSRNSISREENDAEMTVTIGPNTLGGNAYIVLIRAGSPEGPPETFTTLLVWVDCAPPFIFSLPTNQPTDQAVNSGSRATLRVVPSGSGPLRYQWYRGARGSTDFPVAGATGSQFQTDAVTGSASYWVRVSNACGSVDSDVAVISAR
jgi:hypothetical protein